jgi:Tol biopolymer transport system component
MLRKGMGIWNVNSDTTEHEITEPPSYPAGRVTCPAVSPNGQWIAYSMGDITLGNTQDVWAIPASGDLTQRKRLTTGYSTFFPAWSTDGQWVYFVNTTKDYVEVSHL